MEKVDMVVNAPKIPTKRNVLVVSAMSKPYLNIRYDASMQPATLTMNVAQGNSVSTVRYTANLITAPMAPPSATTANRAKVSVMGSRYSWIRVTGLVIFLKERKVARIPAHAFIL